jgi:hypothetical protein
MKSPVTSSGECGAHHQFRFVPSDAGLMYEVVHLVADQHVVRLGRPVISLLELDYPSRALALRRGLR